MTLATTILNSPTDRLRDEILGRAKTLPGDTRGNNVGGWRSKTDVTSWKHPEIKPLFEEILDVLLEATTKRRFKLMAWAIVHSKGSYHDWHDHSGYPGWCGIYYVDPGGPSGARTLFQTTDGIEEIAPEKGLLVLFPSTLKHSTVPHYGDKERVTIAFNAQKSY